MKFYRGVFFGLLLSAALVVMGYALYLFATVDIRMFIGAIVALVVFFAILLRFK
jgi:hypothetical protein